MFLGQGPSKLENGDVNPLAVGIRLDNATIGLVQFDNAGTKTYALTASGDLELVGISGVTLHGRANVRFNNTGQAISETISIPNTTHDVTVQFADGSDVKSFFSQGLEVGVLGQTFKGDFHFGDSQTGSAAPLDAQSGVNASQPISGSVSNLQIGFDNGNNEVAKIANGSGAVLLSAAGLAARASGDLTLEVPGVSLTGTFGVQINTTGNAVSDTGLNLDLPAGPYFKVSAQSAQLGVLGQTLSGSFAVEQRTAGRRAQVNAGCGQQCFAEPRWIFAGGERDAWTGKFGDYARWNRRRIAGRCGAECSWRDVHRPIWRRVEHDECARERFV